MRVNRVCRPLPSPSRPARSPIRRSSSSLPDDPNYAFCPAYRPADRPQQIRIVIDHVPGYVPTALVALTLDDAERRCDRLNARLGQDREAWMKIAGRTMSAGPPRHGSGNGVLQ